MRAMDLPYPLNQIGMICSIIDILASASRASLGNCYSTDIFLLRQKYYFIIRWGRLIKFHAQSL